MNQATAAIVHYKVDTRASQFTVQAFAGGLLSGVAHSPKIAIRDWTGDAHFMLDSLRNASLKVKIKVASFEVLDEMRDSDRREIHRVMFQEVMEAQRYPEVSFDSTEIVADKQNDTLYRVKIAGKLALHGVANDHSFTAQVATGVDSFRAYGEFLLLQPDYNMTVASIAGGTMRLRDEIKFSFYVVARKAE